MSKKLVKPLFWLTISEIIFNLSGYIIHSGVGRMLGPADYGRFAIVITLTTMVISLIGRGIPTAMSKYISEIFDTKQYLIPHIKRQTIRYQIILISFVTLTFLLLAPVIAHILGDKTLTSLFQISSLIIPSFAAATFYFSYYTGLHKFYIQAFLKSLRGLLRVIFVITFTYYFSVSGGVIGYIIAPLILFIIAWIIDVFFTSPYKNTTLTTSQQDEILSYKKKLLTYAWPITLSMVFYEFMITIDLYLIKALLGNDTLTGLYNAALTIGRIPYYLFYAVTIILFPLISKISASGDYVKLRIYINYIFRLQFIVLFPLIVLMILYARDLIFLLFGYSYLDATLPLMILSVGSAFLTIFYVFSFVLNGAGKVKTTLVLTLIGFFINIVLNIYLIPNYGLLGAASATTFSSFMIFLMIIGTLVYFFKISIPYVTLFRISLAILCMVVLSHFIKFSDYWFIFSGGILFIFYIAILFLFREIKISDFKI